MQFCKNTKRQTAAGMRAYFNIAIFAAHGELNVGDVAVRPRGSVQLLDHGVEVRVLLGLAELHALPERVRQLDVLSRMYSVPSSPPSLHTLSAATALSGVVYKSNSLRYTRARRANLRTRSKGSGASHISPEPYILKDWLPKLTSSRCFIDLPAEAPLGLAPAKLNAKASKLWVIPRRSKNEVAVPDEELIQDRLLLSGSARGPPGAGSHSSCRWCVAID